MQSLEFAIVQSLEFAIMQSLSFAIMQSLALKREERNLLNELSPGTAQHPSPVSSPTLSPPAGICQCPDGIGNSDGGGYKEKGSNAACLSASGVINSFLLFSGSFFSLSFSFRILQLSGILLDPPLSVCSVCVCVCSV